MPAVNTTDQFDGGYAPPNPAPLAAAGVRGELDYDLPAAGESEQKAKTLKLFSCMTTCPKVAKGQYVAASPR